MRRILIIDEEPQYRILMQRLLEEAGYQAETAPGGKSGLKLFDGLSYDLVITDMLMSDMDGVAVIQALQSNAIKPAILVVSGGVKMVSVQHLLELAEDFEVESVLAKPFSGQVFLEAVKAILPNRPSKKSQPSSITAI